ncbi:hypothetical protein THAOC_23931 [Thalassiosira oceanica]|uniref:Uncharacterized protein n=1 Tax=Thalassiosira oceanica TaxID=159749 RepID=K0RTC6_THAOC|nr:hypothetical protein THAOC_23931 [Thalassiosira oceanica]|eukprot:EJK56225.1 hypothetical protein THAOC_23931 [Thalassiosira oceanica]
MLANKFQRAEKGTPESTFSPDIPGDLRIRVLYLLHDDRAEPHAVNSHDVHVEKHRDVSQSLALLPPFDLPKTPRAVLRPDGLLDLGDPDDVDPLGEADEDALQYGRHLGLEGRQGQTGLGDVHQVEPQRHDLDVVLLDDDGGIPGRTRRRLQLVLGDAPVRSREVPLAAPGPRLVDLPDPRGHVRARRAALGRERRGPPGAGPALLALGPGITPAVRRGHGALAGGVAAERLDAVALAGLAVEEAVSALYGERVAPRGGGVAVERGEERRRYEDDEPHRSVPFLLAFLYNEVKFLRLLRDRQDESDE